MKKKIFILLTAFIFTLNAFTAAFAVTKKSKEAKVPVKQINQLMAALPNSDAVMTIDMLRLMNEAAPQMLSSKPEFLTKINAKIDEIKGKIGIDLRQFEQLAIGASYTQNSGAGSDFDPVILARGKFNPGAFLGVAKIASKGKYREEQVGGKTVYIFQTTEILQNTKPQTTNPQAGSIFDRFTKTIANEIALTDYDNNTLAMGSTARVKDALSSKPRISRELIELASRKPSAIISFGANTPTGIAQFVPLDVDEIGANLGAIRNIYGIFDYTGGNAVLSTTARIIDDKQARDLEEMLSGLQMLGKGILAGSSGADKQVYARLVEKAVISRNANEVMFDIQIPKTDVDALAGILIK